MGEEGGLGGVQTLGLGAGHGRVVDREIQRESLLCPDYLKAAREERVGEERDMMELAEAMKDQHVLIDVRTGPEMEMVSLPGSVNIPLDVIQSEKHEKKIKEIVKKEGEPPVFVVCRRGNDSQSAVMLLKKMLPELSIKDVKGGLHAWAKVVDKSFPVY